MKKLPALLSIFMLLVSVYPVSGGIPNPADEEIKSKAQHGFEEILDLWHDGKFDALTERTIARGKLSKENFISRLSTGSRKPACCWEKMQDVSITVITDNSVDLRAKVGLEGTGSTEFITKSFRMTKGDGVWKISQSDIFSLAGKRKKIIHHKNKTAHYSKLKTITP